jgi:hypothetical protein
MLKQTFWTLFVVSVVCAASSAAHAQVPGAGNAARNRPSLPPVNMPPAFADLRDPEQHRDEHDVLKHAHIIAHGIGHVAPPPRVSAEPMTNLHTPRVVVPEPTVPLSEFRYAPPRFSPVMSEGAPVLARGVSQVKGGGILAAIGGAIAAVFGGLFGRKQEL